MLKKIFLFTFFILIILTCYSQVECPQNIGFEQGTFNKWECYTGSISPTGPIELNGSRPAVVSLSLSGQTIDQHTLIPKSGLKDEYGQFSLDAPDESNYILKLGNSTAGNEAERISYTMDVPSNGALNSLFFNYAVVFENPSDHDLDEQPKFTVQVFDLTTNEVTECGSFAFVAQGDLTGFKVSQKTDSVLYKPWSPAVIDLSNYRGHKIRLEFTTNDCSRGEHFGYAYIDFYESCDIPISVTGNIVCPEVGSVTLKALPGFAEYRWFDPITRLPLGTRDSLTITPSPPSGTQIGVEVIPYPGLGCTQIFYTVLGGMILNIRDPAPTCTYVDLTDRSLKTGSSPGLTYTYWINIEATIPVSDPKHVSVSGKYYIRGQSSSGCALIRQITITIFSLPPLIIRTPATVTYPSTIDLTKTFTPQDGFTYTYWINQDLTIRLFNPARVRQGGTYYIKAINTQNCSTIAAVEANIHIPDIVIANTFTPNGDGINDVLTVLVNSKVKVAFFKIYSRWGKPVFETKDITNFWDGLKNNTMVPTGVYYWVLEGEDGSKKYQRWGSVAIIR